MTRVSSCLYANSHPRYRSFDDASKEASYWRIKAQDYQDMLREAEASLKDFSESSKELEQEMERELAQSAKDLDDARAKNEKLSQDKDEWKVRERATMLQMGISIADSFSIVLSGSPSIPNRSPSTTRRSTRCPESSHSSENPTTSTRISCETWSLITTSSRMRKEWYAPLSTTLNSVTISRWKRQRF